jgi:hypothetical protein
MNGFGTWTARLVLLLALFPAAAAGSSSLAGSWRPLPAAPIALDGYLTGAWTGTQMIVFGRHQVTKLDARGNPYTVRSFDVAAAYAPATNRWRKLAPRPGPTGGFEGGYSAVWTGKEVLVWGAFDYQAYNPATNRWRLLPRRPGIGAAGGLVVWTGSEMIGWGGGCCGDAFSDGVAYKPATNRWRKLPASPLAGSQSPIGAWTGRELVIFVASLDPDGKPWPARLARAAAYDPASNAWRRLAPLPGGRATSAVWDGREVLVLTAGGALFAYDPAGNRWRRPLRIGPSHLGSAVVWTGKRLLVSGGKIAGGLAYEPSTNRSSPLPRGPLQAREDAVAAWTGRSLIVWGGRAPASGKQFANGAAFTPVTP